MQKPTIGRAGHAKFTPAANNSSKGVVASPAPTVRVVIIGGGQHDRFGSGWGNTPPEGRTYHNRGKVVIC